MTTRKIEVFSAGCPLCEDAVKLVNSLACPSWLSLSMVNWPIVAPDAALMKLPFEELVLVNLSAKSEMVIIRWQRPQFLSPEIIQGNKVLAKKIKSIVLTAMQGEFKS
jgi:hypothetical protein